VVHICAPSLSTRHRSGESRFDISLGKQFARPCLEKIQHKTGPVEWLKVQALSSNPSTSKNIYINKIFPSIQVFKAKREDPKYYVGTYRTI
jgi:hypothetical protein